ncbi:lipase family protein [Marinomonas pollencensis]|uniref:Lipase (Class 3) n=1 Tax=Marinomonas pollencensis TaxID=491954 RepID=A0A3E0DND5_9GAMM|nr:lipase family protein [Marinomonas pollencensis]REG83311.1 lipase (class 3) [Marinomonas pollencensis]
MFHAFALFALILLIAPFQPAFATQDFSVIKSQAQLSDDTYLEADTLESRLQIQGQRLVHQSLISDSQVSYFLSTTKDVQTIAVRGTANLQNAMIDLTVSLQADPVLDIKLHQGFASAARAIYANMKPYLNKNQPIHITGHSLGGAIAVILGMYLQTDGYAVTQVITFGQPKVTNVTGAKKFDDLPLIRVVTLHDIVPLVPPISPLQIKNLDIFWHMGTEVILMGDKQYAETSGVKSALRATKFTTSIPSEKNLHAHKMTTYLARINELLASPVEVPYKTDINLFGFSFD